MAVTDSAEQSRVWDRWAPTYDRDSVGLDVTQTVEALARLAGPAPDMRSRPMVLELGVGTGRIALPLADRGLEILGLDTSTEMTARLLARRGARHVEVRIADMSSFDVGCRRFDLVYVVASTFFLLTSQEQQLACLASCAAAMTRTASLVVETSVPGTAALSLESRQCLVREVGPAHVKVSVIDHDPVSQTLRSQEIRCDDGGGVVMLPMLRRYTFPSELDLMARLAGLALVGRYGDWDLQPYRAGGHRQVSVYRLR